MIRATLRRDQRCYACGIGRLLVAAILMCSGAAAAQDEPAWTVKEKLFGEKDNRSKDVSGIACNSPAGFPRSCLLVDDESQGAQIVIVQDGEIVAGQVIPLIDDRDDDDEPIELDGEGVAFANGFFYVIGSHGHPRDKNNDLDPVKDRRKIESSIKANSRVIRVRIDPAAIDRDGKLTAPPEIKRSAELGKLLADETTLQPFFGERLEKNGLTVEGVAVRDGRLYAAMRAPSLPGNQAAILSVALGALFDGAAPDAKLHPLRLGKGRGVRDLAAFENGFLVLAGPSAETKGTYSMYSWDGGDVTKWLKDLPDLFDKKGEQIKPEALLPLDRTTEGLRVLVLFDGPKDGEPRAFRIPYP
jgi:Protein of unknown function (DUF3616)